VSLEVLQLLIAIGLALLGSLVPLRANGKMTRWGFAFFPIAVAGGLVSVYQLLLGGANARMQRSLSIRLRLSP
jgi:hypothetical protein